MAKNKSAPNIVKYIAAGYFILIALLNLAETLWNSRDTLWRDIILLLLASLPLLINKRLLYLSYGIILSLITLTILIAYIAMHDYAHSKISFPYFLLGMLIHTISLSCALGFIYTGTYSQDKNRFQLL